MKGQAVGMRDTELDALCAAWPGVTSVLRWEVDRVYQVGGRMFAVVCTLGPDRGRLSFRVEADRFVELSGQPGMMPAPYTGQAFWVSVTEPERFATGQLAAFVTRSYELVRAGLSRRTRDALASDEAGSDTPP